MSYTTTIDVFPSKPSHIRHAFLDNAKYALILVVVLNHSTQDFLEHLDGIQHRSWCDGDSINVNTHRGIRVGYLMLNAIGMPLFSAISGYCSRRWLSECRAADATQETMMNTGTNTVARRLKISAMKLLWPYLGWNTFYMVLLYPRETPFQFWAPIGITWYLLGLFLWRWSILVLGGLKDRYIMASSLFMGGFVGFTETATTKSGYGFLMWQRLFAYSPYFFFGLLYVKPEYLVALNETPYLKRGPFGVAALAAIYCGIWLAMYGWGTRCFDEAQRLVWQTSPYATTKVYTAFVECFYRVLVWIGSFGIGAAFMAVVPCGEYFFTKFGARTLYCYLLHILLLKAYGIVMAEFWPSAPLSFRLTASALWLPLIVSHLTLSETVSKIFKPVVEPDFSALDAAVSKQPL